MNEPKILEAVVERRPLSEQVFHLLEERILSGKLTPGTKLAEEAIAEEFGISRSPAREALIQLERCGLAEKSGPRDRQVAIPSPKFITDVYATWIILETGRNYLSSLKATPKDHKRIREVLRLMEKALAAEDMTAYREYYGEFHVLLRARCDNEQLDEAIRRFDRHRRWLTALYRKEPDTTSRALIEHKLIAKSYIKRDLVGLTRHLLAHMEHQRDQLLARVVAPERPAKKPARHSIGRETQAAE